LKLDENQKNFWGILEKIFYLFLKIRRKEREP
jgi:hypothetical protein